MNDKPNFSSLLDDVVTEINRPKPLPIGTYTCVVGRWERGESSKKKTPFIKFPLTVIAAGEDVDADELDAMGGFDGRRLSVTFYTTEDAIYRLDEFHSHCGIDIENNDLSRRQLNDEVLNSQVGVVISHRYPETADGQADPDAVPFAEVKRTFAI